MQEKRLSGRLLVNLSSELWSADGEILLCQIRMMELSPTGCRVCFEKETTPPRDVKIKFGFEKAAPFFINSEIIWTAIDENKFCAGLKFKNLSMIEKEKIRKYMRDLKYGERYIR
ncbi:MAG: PilZ domain-containing protein [Elusimicrobiota bacterium]